MLHKAVCNKTVVASVLSFSSAAVLLQLWQPLLLWMF